MAYIYGSVAISNYCCVCGHRLTGTSWVCRKCAMEHGLTGNGTDWPDWAKALVQSERRERRYQATVGRITVSYDSAGVENLVYGESNDDVTD